jgi:FlaA1/EpsC-like NDP-sugar epimerase
VSAPLVAIIVKYRRVLIVVLHMAIIALSNYLAFWLRFEGQVPARYWTLFARTLPWLVLVRTLTFVPFRLYEGLWRYTGVWDLSRIISAVGISSLAFVFVVRFGHGFLDYPRSVFVIDAMVLVFFLGGLRLLRRVYREGGLARRDRRILIFGAGDAGEMVVRDMKNNAFYDCEPIGFVDDDPAKVGHRIHGVPVLGTRADLAEILARENPHEVLVAIPRADPPTIRSIVKALEPFKVPIKTLPNLRDVLNGRVTVSEIRNLSIEDLLPRAPVGLDSQPVDRLIRGRRVLVTGAGGSIGSELCRHISRHGPASLILFERYENGAYAIESELADAHPAFAVRAVIGDITDVARVEAVMQEYRPEVVFHAAAHKHVPLMEANRCEAVRNNVGGTRIVAEAADRCGASHFVLISTDKAVNPVSTMGATKRIAELVVQAMSRESRTNFVTVRFGNVLNSNGSVVPRFLQQIRAGGPVTVTHREARRYFMLIPEAVQLVLHAAALGGRGALYALDMGDQIPIIDVARNLIRLSGWMPDTEIPITIIGLRPGEKLAEELVGADESQDQSPVDKVIRVTPHSAPEHSALLPKVLHLERCAAEGRTDAVIRGMCELVPTFVPEPELPASVAVGHVTH